MQTVPPVPARHNLPRALTALIGREAEQRAVVTLLASAPLVTLTGSGGVGKTRLALAVAGAVVDQYPDGVWLVELAALAEERLVAQSVLEVLGTREEPGRSLLETLTGHLCDQRLLLVLDNCEHLIGACAALAEAVLRRLRRCAGAGHQPGRAGGGRGAALPRALACRTRPGCSAPAPSGWPTRRRWRSSWRAPASVGPTSC